MGYTRQDISRIFLWQAAIVLMIGTVAGWILGAVVTYGISNLPIRIRGIFAMDTFIVNWSIWHYVAATPRRSSWSWRPASSLPVAPRAWSRATSSAELRSKPA